MNNVILIGMPASGKSSVMGAYKSTCKNPTFDTDECIASRYGDIPEIFKNYGEEHFRALETQVIREVCKNDGALIATGGGSVLREENVKTFKESGKIVYLRTKIGTLLKRLKGDASRPLLAGNVAERLEKLYTARSAIYERVADIIIDTDDLTAQDVLQKIIVACGV